MRRITIYISAFFCFILATASAQEFISADKRSGCDSLVVQFTLNNALPIEQYTAVEWHFGDGTSQNGTLSPVHKYGFPRKYSVFCELDGGRRIIEENFITISITPFADFRYSVDPITETELKYTFEPVHFNPVNGIDLNYTWKLWSRIDTNSIIKFEQNPEYSIFQDDTSFITLHITDQVGCTSLSDTLKIIGSKGLLIPNVFSPNGDDTNDYFEVTTSGEDVWLFRVFSRDGLQVYFSNSPEISWDGHLVDGREAPEGVYYYSIEKVGSSAEEDLYKGFIYLFRKIRNPS